MSDADRKKARSRGLSRDMSPAAIARRFEILVELDRAAQALRSAGRHREPETGLPSTPGPPAAGSPPQTVRLQDDGTFPNSRKPLLLYSAAVPADPSAIEELFTRNDWPAAWRNGVYPYHHYHSNAHEVLGAYSGSAHLQFGGPGGAVQGVRAGDIVVIPAGVAHKRLESSPDFRVVGAYPGGQSPDMCYGRAGERPAADRRIAVVPDPTMDPVQGTGGALCRLWQVL
ncbi:MAG: hypothetical protein JW820_18890 [Spirochaetales bacterium]|nr:hypothetical protein [Spirochaetales bacterium]